MSVDATEDGFMRRLTFVFRRRHRMQALTIRRLELFTSFRTRAFSVASEPNDFVLFPDGSFSPQQTDENVGKVGLSGEFSGYMIDRLTEISKLMVSFCLVIELVGRFGTKIEAMPLDISLSRHSSQASKISQSTIP